MRSIFIPSVLLAIVCVSPATARENQVYIGIEGGVALPQDINLTVVGVEADLEQKTGYNIGAVAGYDFGQFRLEAEANYSKVDNESVSSTTPFFPRTTATRRSGTYALNGRSKTLNLMANAMVETGDDDKLQLFIGGGVGIAIVDTTATFFGPAWIDESSSSFAYQGFAGGRIPLNDQIDVNLKYRFLAAPNINYTDRVGGDVSGNFTSHSMLVGINYNFK